jgi:acyl carrier protein
VNDVERQDLETVARVRQVVAETLEMTVQSLNDDNDIRDYGADSVAVTIIAEKLEQSLGIEVDQQLIVESATVTAIASALAERLASTTAARRAPSRPAPGQ